MVENCVLPCLLYLQLIIHYRNLGGEKVSRLMSNFQNDSLLPSEQIQSPDLFPRPGSYEKRVFVAWN